MSHWPDPLSARTGQGEGSSASNWEEDEGRRSATTNLGAEANKDDDISVLLEDSDDEWIPGMLKN